MSEGQAELLDLYQAINNQFVYDFGALPLVLKIWCGPMARDEWKRLFRRLARLHQAVTETSREEHRRRDDE